MTFYTSQSHIRGVHRPISVGSEVVVTRFNRRNWRELTQCRGLAILQNKSTEINHKRAMFLHSVNFSVLSQDTEHRLSLIVTWWSKRTKAQVVLTGGRKPN